MKKTINARGWDCPRPIIETKKLLDTMREGTVLTTVDNNIAVKNLISFSESMGYSITCAEKDGEPGVFDIEVTKTPSEYDESGAAGGDLIIQITSNAYGGESGGLGENLMKAYIYALTEVAPLPGALMFLNKGAFLTAEGSAVLDSLKTLEAEGVEILTCGVCINFFGLAESPAAGSVTNMYAMVEKLNNAGNAIVI